MTIATHIPASLTFGLAAVAVVKPAIVPSIIWGHIIGACLPDIDYADSAIGKIFYPVSIRIEALFGHRTFCHSLLFMWIIYIILKFCNLYLFAVSTNFIIGIMLGMFFHNVVDMLNPGGVALFWPFVKTRMILTRSPAHQIKVGSKAEFLFLGACIFIFIFTYPLLKKGAWTWAFDTSGGGFYGMVDECQKIFKDRDTVAEVSGLISLAQAPLENVLYNVLAIRGNEIWLERFGETYTLTTWTGGTTSIQPSKTRFMPGRIDHRGRLLPARKVTRSVEARHFIHIWHFAL